MTLSPRAATVLLLIVLAGFGGAGVYAGAALGRSVTEQGTRVVRVFDPELAASTLQDARRSAGGFTGFGGLPALDGDVLRSGTVEALADGEIVVTAVGSETVIRYAQETRLFVIRPAEELVVGEPVLVRTVDGEVTGVLRLRQDEEREQDEAGEGDSDEEDGPAG